MLSAALLFPGQGSQHPAMLSAIADHPVVAATLDEAGAHLGRDWRDLDAEDALSRTDGAQLALTISSVACARALLAEGAAFDVVCGHSVGAYPAAVTAGVLPFVAALDLVALRGRLMAALHAEGFGMTAILGLRETAVAGLVEQARAAGPLYVSNRNGDLQIVVSGADAALEEVSRLALDAGARKAERLAVRTPSHSPLVAGVADSLAQALAGVEISRPKLAYVSSRRARVLREPAAIAEDLAMNVAEPVLWRDAMRLLRELGVEVAIETGPGTVLRDLATEQMPDAEIASLADTSIGSCAHLARRGR